MINKLSILFAVIGIVICVFNLIFPDRLPIFGLLSAFLGAIIFILNWHNGWKSVLLTVYLVAILGSLIGSNGYAIFQTWYTITTVAVLPLVCLFLGLSMDSGTILDRIRESQAYILCIASIALANYMFVAIVSFAA